jgi:hypothetical protein
MGHRTTTDDEPWLAIDPINNQYGLICKHCAMRLVASGAALIPEPAGERDVDEDEGFIVILTSGNTLDNTGVLH